MSKYSISLTLIISGLLSACGGSSDIPEVNTPVNPNTTINTVSVVGTSVTVNNIIPINSGINGGAFSIAWDVDSSDPYHVDLYLSEDNTLGDDVKFFSQNCGSSTLIYNCGTLAQFDCRFTSSNKISCGMLSAFNTEKDLTSFLDTIPKQASLIIEACNALMDNCKTTSVAIELQ
mgnify:FL=1